MNMVSRAGAAYPRQEVTRMIENWANHSRAIAYDELRFGRNRPSDLDGILILPDATIVIEYKCGESEVKGMQKKVLETLVDDAEKAGKRSVAFVARFYDRDPRNTVNAALCFVTEAYISNRWYDIRKLGFSLKQAMEQFMGGGE